MSPSHPISSVCTICMRAWLHTLHAPPRWPPAGTEVYFRPIHTTAGLRIGPSVEKLFSLFSPLLLLLDSPIWLNVTVFQSVRLTPIDCPEDPLVTVCGFVVMEGSHFGGAHNHCCWLDTLFQQRIDKQKKGFKFKHLKLFFNNDFSHILYSLQGSFI